MRFVVALIVILVLAGFIVARTMLDKAGEEVRKESSQRKIPSPVSPNTPTSGGGPPPILNGSPQTSTFRGPSGPPHVIGPSAPPPNY